MLNKTEHGSSDGRAGEARLKDPNFESCLDPMRRASKCKLFCCYVLAIKVMENLGKVC